MGKLLDCWILQIKGLQEQQIPVYNEKSKDMSILFSYLFIGCRFLYWQFQKERDSVRI